MSTTHLVAISNQVRQRNECYKDFVKGLQVHAQEPLKQRNGERMCYNGHKRSEIFHFVILAMFKCCKGR